MVYYNCIHCIVRSSFCTLYCTVVLLGWFAFWAWLPVSGWDVNIDDYSWTGMLRRLSCPEANNAFATLASITLSIDCRKEWHCGKNNDIFKLKAVLQIFRQLRSHEHNPNNNRAPTIQISWITGLPRATRNLTWFVHFGHVTRSAFLGLPGTTPVHGCYFPFSHCTLNKGRPRDGGTWTRN